MTSRSAGPWPASHRTFAQTLAERQSLMVPSEDPDCGDLGQAFPPWPGPARGAILQPPKPEIRPSPEVLQRAADLTWEAPGELAVLEFVQGTGLVRFAPVKPQRWVVASFEHHTSPHGLPRPHIHNIAVASLTTAGTG
jgi:hypothetical protein